MWRGGVNRWARDARLLHVEGFIRAADLDLSSWPLADMQHVGFYVGINTAQGTENPSCPQGQYVANGCPDPVAGCARPFLGPESFCRSALVP